MNIQRFPNGTYAFGDMRVVLREEGRNQIGIYVAGNDKPVATFQSTLSLRDFEKSPTYMERIEDALTRSRESI